MNRQLFQLIVIALASLLVVSACKKKVKTEIVEVPSVPGRPSVNTLAVDSLSSSSVVLSGQITREGNGDISTAGFCWSDEKLPVADETPTQYLFPDNKFIFRLNGLKPGTTYNFRAFATNEKGTGYGETVTFKTLEGWKKIEPAPNTPIRQYSEMVSTGTRLAGINYSNVYTSADNGLTWSSSTNGMMGSINCLANLGETLFAGTPNGVYVSNNGGGVWIPANSGLPANTAVNFMHAHNNYIFAATNYSLFRSANNGQTWSVITFSNTFDYVFGFASQGSSLILLKSNAIYVSEDNGASWTSTPFTAGIYPNKINGMTSALIAIAAQKLYRSVDKGKTWSIVNLSGYVNEMVTSGNNAIAIANGSTLYISSDGGNSWVRNDGGLQGISTAGFVFHKNFILGSTYNGLYKLVLN